MIVTVMTSIINITIIIITMIVTITIIITDIINMIPSKICWLNISRIKSYGHENSTP